MTIRPFLLMILLLTLCIRTFSQIKIFVETDLEGVSGVYNFTQTREKNSPENLKACEYFMEDLAALVRGLRDGGATEILIIDGHGNQAMIPHLMEPGAKYVTGKPRPYGNRWGLDESFSGLVMFGFHAMNGTPDGVLHHTQSSMSENKYWYNGRESGELAQTALIAGHFGVPPILVIGDEATCREANQFFGNNLVTVATKKGLAREAAVLYPFEETRKAIYEGAKKAISIIPECKPYTIEMPINAKMQHIQIEPNTNEKKVVTREWVIPDAIRLFER
jgi:D-amino peptidase